MFNQLLGNNSYNSYNIKIANLFGLESAVYLNSILSLNSKDNIIQVDRDSIKNLTTLTVDAHRDADKLFKKLNVFELQSKDEIIINYSALLSLFNSEYEAAILDIAPKLVKKRTKSDAIKDELKSFIKSDNGELRDAYSSWIDSVFAKQGWMSKKSVELGQASIDEFSERKLDVAIGVLNIASIGGYRDVQWAIKSYKENKASQNKSKSFSVNKETEVKKQIELAQEVF